MSELSELSNAVLEYIGSFEGDAPKDAILMKFRDEIESVLDELMQQNLINRRWVDGDGMPTVGGGFPFPIMLGPSGDYYLEDNGKIVLAELRLAKKNESKREIKKKLLDFVCGVATGFVVGVLLGYYGFR